MNNATLEHLFQIATPPRDMGSTTRSRNDAPPFDSLFRQVTEPQSRGSNSTDSTPPPSFSTGSVESQPVESSAPPQDEPAASPSAPSSDDGEYTTETAAASHDEREDHEPEADEAAELTAAETAVAAPTAAAEPRPEIALADEVEQLTEVAAAADAPADVKEKTEAKQQLATADASVGVPAEQTSDATSEVKATEQPTTEVTETAAEDQAKPTAKTSELHATAKTHTTPTATQEAKASSRSRIKNTKDEAVTDGKSKPTDSSATAHTDKSHETKAAEVAIANQPIASESAAKETETMPAIQRLDSRTDDKPTAVAMTNDQPVAATRPAAVNSAPIAVNVPQQTQTAVTKTVATTDAKTKPDAIRAKDSTLSPFARLERNQAGAAHGARASAVNSASTPQVDPARFVSRVARAINTAQERGGPLQLRLSPPELGAMRIELSVNQGALTATIETDNTAARQVLLENLPALRERLAEQNVKIERFDVDVRRDGSGQQNPAAQQQNDSSHQQRSAARGQSFRGTTNRTTADEPAPVRRTITVSSINVIA